MTENPPNAPETEKPKVDLKDIKGITEKVKGIDTSYLDKTRAALSSLKDSINQTIKGIKEKKGEVDKEIKIDQYDLEDDKNPLYVGFLKDMAELGITDPAKIKEHWTAVSDDFKNYLESVKNETVTSSPEFSNLSGFVDNLEAQLPDVAKTMEEKNPLSEYKEKFQKYLKDNALLQWLVSFLGPNILASAQKEENEKGTTYSSRLYRALSYVMGVEKGQKPAAAAAEKPAEKQAEGIPDFVKTYVNELKLNEESGLNQFKQLTETYKITVDNDLIEKAKKSGSGTELLINAYKNQIGNLPIALSLLDVRFSSDKFTAENINTIAKNIKDSQTKSPDAIRQYLDAIIDPQKDIDDKKDILKPKKANA